MPAPLARQGSVRELAASKASTIGRQWRAKPRIVEAMREYGNMLLSAEGPDALNAIREVMNDVREPAARLRAAAMVWDRNFPIVQKVDVRHEVIDHTQEAVKALREFKKSGATREFLEEWFGYSGLMKYEKLLLEQDKGVIEAEFTVVDKDLADLEELLK